MHCTVYWHCALYTVYWSLCTVHCVLNTVYCILCTEHCALYTVYCTVYTVQCTVYTHSRLIRYFPSGCRCRDGRYAATVYTEHCTLYTVHCTLYTVHCTLYTVHCCSLFSALECSGSIESSELGKLRTKGGTVAAGGPGGTNTLLHQGRLIMVGLDSTTSGVIRFYKLWNLSLHMTVLFITDWVLHFLWTLRWERKEWYFCVSCNCSSALNNTKKVSVFMVARVAVMDYIQWWKAQIHEWLEPTHDLLEDDSLL